MPKTYSIMMSEITRVDPPTSTVVEAKTENDSKNDVVAKTDEDKKTEKKPKGKPQFRYDEYGYVYHRIPALPKPVFDFKMLISIQGWLRKAQMILSVVAIVLVQNPRYCYFREFGYRYYNTTVIPGVVECTRPNPYATGTFAVTLGVAGFVVLVMEIIYVFSFHRVYNDFPFFNINLTQSLTSSISIFIMTSIMVGFSQTITKVVVSTSLAYVVSLLLACSFIRALVEGDDDYEWPDIPYDPDNPTARLFARNPALAKMYAECKERAHEYPYKFGIGCLPRPPGWVDKEDEIPADTVAGDGEISGQITSRTSSTASLPKVTSTTSNQDEENHDNLSISEVSTAEVALQAHDGSAKILVDYDFDHDNDNGSVSGFSDKGSWVLTSSLKVDGLSNSMADNISTTTYTVEVPLDD
ncbi:hypothetical protein CHUAL_008381 [Chamberlinius hualienensis]